jgi:hypothetical protein
MRTEVGITIVFFITLGTDFNPRYIFTFPVYFAAALEAYYWSWVVAMKYNQSTALGITAKIGSFSHRLFQSVNYRLYHFR